MDPQMQGAILGAGATALGSAIAWIGARAQARAALEAVRMQVRGQRFDARWQVSRDAYAAFFGAVEDLQNAPSADELDDRLLRRSGELAQTVDHVMQSARDWLDAAPDVDPPRRSLWSRLCAWYHDRRLRRVLD